MSLIGHVQNGVVVFEPPLTLPEGTVVEVAVRTAAVEAESNLEGGPTIYDRYKDMIGMAVGLPDDFAANHDHYIHGTPKR